ncbi:MAG: methyltransferase domain-containing protein [Chloroflexaceae bacterium]|nr:methyltransferase domain-containing protein [Chloroflexaceae bacterium]
MMQQFWDDYYTNNEKPWLSPDPDLMAVAATLPPGCALDLGAGEGADSLWLAQQGWAVTAVDFAPAAIATIQRLANEHHLHISGIIANVVTYQPDTLYDLIFMCYLHLPASERNHLLNQVQQSLAPHGRFLYIGIVRPDDTTETDIPLALLATPSEIVAVLSGLTIERVDQHERVIGCPEGDFTATVQIIQAYRPNNALASG